MVEDKSKRKEVYFVPRLKFKELEDELPENTYRFVGASTLPDRTREQLPDGTIIEGEILSKDVLDKFASWINDESVVGGKYGSYRTVGLFHDRVYEQNPYLEEAGFVKAGSAKVVPNSKYPGHFDLIVDVETNKMYKPSEKYPDWTSDKINYKIEKDALGLSIEYNNPKESERIVDVNGEKYRFVMDSDDFRGFSYARVNVIGNPVAVRVKEIDLRKNIKKDVGGKMEKNEKLEADLLTAQAKIKELNEELEKAKEEKKEEKVEEVEKKVEEVEAKIKELKLSQDSTAAKIKERIELAFGSLNFSKPAATSVPGVKVKEIYHNIDKVDFVKFKEQVDEHLEKNGMKIKEMLARDGPGFDFERWTTLKVKCQGNKFVVVPSAKTKDVVDATDMAESTYYQTNAMFADRYVAGITETFLKEDSLLKVMPKEMHIGGNDKYQWKLWVEYGTVTGTSTFAVDPNVTSVTRSQRNFEKMETPIREYRDGVEVTDFVQHHSMAAVGDLMGIEIQRASEVVVESMNADLFKEKCDGTTAWVGFNGLGAIADSTGNGTLYGKTRSADNRLLDATLANTYVSTSEAITVSIVRQGYEKVLAHGSNLGELVIVMHPTQCRKLFDSEDAAIRNNILTMAGAPPSWGFNRAVVPHLDGIPIIRDYRCESSAAAADTFVVVDLSKDKGFNLVVSKPLGVRGLAKVGTSESAYVNFWGCTVYKSPRNIFLHDSLTT